MDIAAYSQIPQGLLEQYNALLLHCGLTSEGACELYIFATHFGRVLGCVALDGCVIKQLAVLKSAEGEGIAALLVSQAVLQATQRGRGRLFLFTKPQNRFVMGSLGFYPVIQTSDALMMENRRDGLEQFLTKTLDTIGGSADGAVVCNCNPFTLGHQHLIEYAAQGCKRLAVFVLSQQSGMFSFSDRLEMVRRGTEHINNACVLGGGDYIISNATFPTYFIKDRARVNDIRADLDLLLFAKKIAPALGIEKRFVGEEPFDTVTNQYNIRMKQLLNEAGISVFELPRYKGISASRVRRLIDESNLLAIRPLVPKTTYEYCENLFK